MVDIQKKFLAQLFVTGAGLKQAGRQTGYRIYRTESIYHSHSFRDRSNGGNMFSWVFRGCGSYIVWMYINLIGAGGERSPVLITPTNGEVTQFSSPPQLPVRPRFVSDCSHRIRMHDEPRREDEGRGRCRFTYLSEMIVYLLPGMAWSVLVVLSADGNSLYG